MRLLLVAVALAALAAVTVGCAAPALTVAPVTLEPGDASGPPQTAATASPTPPVTEAPSPAPSMEAFDTSYPDEGWVVASAVDATGSVERVITYGRAMAGALLDLAYTCEHRATLSILVSDGRSTAAGSTLFRFETNSCRPGEIGRVSAPSISETMTINLEATVDPPVHFWVKLAVPRDGFLR